MVWPRSRSESEQSRRSWSQLRQLLGGRRWPVVAVSVASILCGLTEAGILAVVAEVAASLVSGATHVDASIGSVRVTTTVGVLLAAAFALAIARVALSLPVSLLPARIAAEVQARLRKDLFGAFTRAAWAEQARDREGHLQEMMTSQVVQASDGAAWATTCVVALFTFLVLVASALALNVVAAVVVLGAAALVFGVLRPLNAVGHRRSQALSEAQMRHASGIGEAVRLAEETQAFGTAAAQRTQIDGLVTGVQQLYARTQELARLIPSLYQSMIFLILMTGLAALYAAGASHVASLGAVVLLLVRAGTYGQQIQGSYHMVQQALPFITRLEDAQGRYLASVPITGQRRLSTVRTLALENVSYGYQSGTRVLSDIDFEVTRGETVGIIGPSGSGKSTLVQILLQLRTPDDGRYLLNETPVDQFARDDWHRHVAYVPQEPRLVHASVADNIRFFRLLDDAAVERAAELARIHEDVVGWSGGYRTIIGPRADALSGGQQQRICLARALAGEPEVLVLDEPTSSLDLRSETLIQDSLTALKGDVTLFIVAHRMSTLDVCDRVMVIVDGQLQAFDTMELLRQNSDYYRSMSILAARTAVLAAPIGDNPRR